jgi:arabinofuranosyltransferase
VRKYRVELLLILTGVVIVRLLLSLLELHNDYNVHPSLTEIGVPLDDVYIHCRYAANLLAGNGYCFNPGPIVTADTSPLWVALLACGGLFTLQIHIVAVALSSLFYVLLAPTNYRLALSLGLEKRWSVLVGICTLLAARIVWSAPSGMEITLACLLTVLTIKVHVDSQKKGTPTVLEGILLALSIATRPELMFLAGGCFVDWVLFLRKKDKQYKSLLLPSFFFLISVLPVFALPLIERGSLIYHSSVVQGAGLSLLPNVGYLWFACKILLFSIAPTVLVSLFAPTFLWKEHKWRLLIVFGLGLPILLSFVAPQFRHHGRYFFPVMPILIVVGTAVLVSLLSKEYIKKYVWCVQVALSCFALVGAWIWANNYQDCVANINDQHVAASEWIERNSKVGDVIASQDVGAIAYFTKKNVIDLVGLVSPDMYTVQHDQKEVWRTARAQGANLFFIYKRLNPSFYEYAKDSLELAAEWRVTPPLIASADTVFSCFRVKGEANASR